MDLAGGAADWPAWISAIASVLTLLFAALAGWVAFRVYRIESRRDEAAAADQSDRAAQARRAQAALVSAWWGRHSSLPGIFVRNASEVPVYQASVSLIDPVGVGLAEVVELPVVPPADQPVFHPVMGIGGTPRVVFGFTDAAERRWIRDQRGGLHESDDALTVFADLNRSAVLLPLLEEFGKTRGVRVRVRTAHWANLRTEFLAACATGTAPDILIGAHDWVGQLAGEGLIAPIDRVPDAAKLFDPLALRAFQHGGELYGLPYAMENLALIRNTALAPEAPSSIEDLIETGGRLVLAGRATDVLAIPIGPSGNPYHLQPLVSAGGGYLFGRLADGTADLTDVGLDSAASLASFERIRALGEAGRGVLRRSMLTRQAQALFTSGYAPYLISGPWALPAIEKAGTPYAVSALPGYQGGQPGVSFLGVQGFLLAAQGRNRTLAAEFLAGYATRADVALALYEAERRQPALLSARARLGTGGAMAGFGAAGAGAILMPASAAMAEVWEILGEAEAAVIGGASVPSTVGDAATRIRRLVP
ncbi:sugar ABC transporter substrate-binding protein [Longispora albida]|uniref:sugar ABC transporter substrate-binding protein n=1 Tax=Longispora albida TaxID=203523 RepID=UPI0003A7179E|nr:extracellular solute-binding protein [Longispora albida]